MASVESQKRTQELYKYQVLPPHIVKQTEERNRLKLKERAELLQKIYDDSPGFARDPETTTNNTRQEINQARLPLELEDATLLSSQRMREILRGSDFLLRYKLPSQLQRRFSPIDVVHLMENLVISYGITPQATSQVNRNVINNIPFKASPTDGYEVFMGFSRTEIVTILDSVFEFVQNKLNILRTQEEMLAVSKSDYGKVALPYYPENQTRTVIIDKPTTQNRKTVKNRNFAPKSEKSPKSNKPNNIIQKSISSAWKWFVNQNEWGKPSSKRKK